MLQSKLDFLQKAWINGEFKPITDSSVAVSVATHSMQYASSVFEGIVCYDSKIFMLKEHVDRLFRSAEIMHLSLPYTKAQINEACEELLQVNDCLKGCYYIRPLIWRPQVQIKIHADASAFAGIAIFARPHVQTSSTSGIKLLLSSWTKPPECSIPTQCKGSGNYMSAILAKYEAAALGADEALLLHSEGCIAECASANIFFLFKNKLVTPTTRHCLQGITRGVIFDIAKRFSIEIEERDLWLEEAVHADSAFITGTSVGVSFVSSILFPKKADSLKFERLGPVKLLQQEYNARLTQTSC